VLNADKQVVGLQWSNDNWHIISQAPIAASGVYTPTSSNLHPNVTSLTPDVNQWSQNGRCITVSGKASLNQNFANTSQWRLTVPTDGTVLPHTTSFAGNREAGGTWQANSGANLINGYVESVTGTAQVNFNGFANTTGTFDLWFIFHYQIC
jgi:hypothetical protein